MPVEGIDYFLEENLEGKGELQPLIEILQSRQKHKPKEDDEINWEDIME